MLARPRARPGLAVPEARLSIEARIAQLMERLSDADACGFEELFNDAWTRPAFITTFLALLEMIRLKLVRVLQAASFGPIRVYRRTPPPDAPRPGEPSAHG